MQLQNSFQLLGRTVLTILDYFPTECVIFSSNTLREHMHTDIQKERKRVLLEIRTWTSLKLEDAGTLDDSTPTSFSRICAVHAKEYEIEHLKARDVVPTKARNFVRSTKPRFFPPRHSP